MLTPRKLTVAVSGLGLVAAIGIAFIALAFLSRGEEASGTSVVEASPTPTLPPPTSTVTVAPTSEARAPVAPTPTTIGAGPKPTLTATVPAPPATPTSPAPRTTPPPSRPGGPSPDPSGPDLPDLTVLDLSVSGDLVSALIGNVGSQPVPGGTAIQLVVRGTLESKTLPQALSPGGSFTLLLGQQYIYQSEMVTAVVDPNGLVPEANEANNGLTRHLEPDVLLDLALTGLSAVATDEHLAVSVRNNSPVPARQVSVRLSVYRSGSTDPVSVTVQQLSLGPQGTVVLQPAISAVRGLSLRVVLEVMGIVDGNPANNVLEAPIP